MTSTARTTDNQQRSAHRTRGAQMVAAVAEAWSDCRHASRRYIELQTGPVGPHPRTPGR